MDSLARWAPGPAHRCSHLSLTRPPSVRWPCLRAGHLPCTLAVAVRVLLVRALCTPACPLALSPACPLARSPSHFPPHLLVRLPTRSPTRLRIRLLARSSTRSPIRPPARPSIRRLVHLPLVLICPLSCSTSARVPACAPASAFADCVCVLGIRSARSQRACVVACSLDHLVFSKSVLIPVRLLTCLIVYPTVCPPVCPPVRLPARPFAHSPVCPLARLPARPFACPSACPPAIAPVPAFRPLNVFARGALALRARGRRVRRTARRRVL